jgi:hypothetical protein
MRGFVYLTSTIAFSLVVPRKGNTLRALPHRAWENLTSSYPKALPTPSFRVANMSRFHFRAKLREGTREVRLERTMASCR